MLSSPSLGALNQETGHSQTNDQGTLPAPGLCAPDPDQAPCSLHLLVLLAGAGVGQKSLMQDALQ